MVFACSFLLRASASPTSGVPSPSVTSSQSVLAHDKDINAVAVAPHDRLVASASADKTIKLWNTADLSLVHVLRGHKRGVWSIEFSSVDKVIASASGMPGITQTLCSLVLASSALKLSVALIDFSRQVIAPSVSGLLSTALA
jgi:U3 small nucleolar RNA-associated protein 13